MVLTYAFEEAGYSVETAMSLPEAVEAAKGGDYDVILTDLRLPGADHMEDDAGLHLINELRAMKPHTPVVLMTGYHTADVAIKAAQLGAFDYIIKRGQGNVAEVLAAVKKALQKCEQRGEP